MEGLGWGDSRVRHRLPGRAGLESGWLSSEGELPACPRRCQNVTPPKPVLPGGPPNRPRTSPLEEAEGSHRAPGSGLGCASLSTRGAGPRPECFFQSLRPWCWPASSPALLPAPPARADHATAQEHTSGPGTRVAPSGILTQAPATHGLVRSSCCSIFLLLGNHSAEVGWAGPRTVSRLSTLSVARRHPVTGAGVLKP